MKHDLSVTLMIIALFLLSHFVGLFIIESYLPEDTSFPLGMEKPEMDEQTSFIPIIFILIIATLIALLLIKLKALRIWKFWYLLSIFIAMIIAFAAFTPEVIAIILAAIFAILKVFKPHVLIHNFTEVFIYGGLAAIFVPVLGILSVILLLAFISLYDAIAVWKTKHMISMAKFQAKSKMFAGILLPYGKPTKKTKKVSQKQAILGGGDIAFPLMFSGVMLKNFGFGAAIITSITAAIALLILFFLADKKKFYPAMPFISIGSLLGYLIVFLYF